MSASTRMSGCVRRTRWKRRKPERPSISDGLRSNPELMSKSARRPAGGSRKSELPVTATFSNDRFRPIAAAIPTIELAARATTLAVLGDGKPMFQRAILLVFLLSSSAAFADSWMPPSKETYVAPDQSARLTVVPRDLKSAYAYFDDKVEGREPAGAPYGSKETSATVILELRSASGRWETAWRKPLINEIAPVDVVVANNGQGFATFDNWHSVGHGPNAIVIYGRDGTLIRKFGLEDLFPPWFVAALPHSVSSIHWRGDPRISTSGTELIVPVVQPSNDEFSIGGGRTVDLSIRLADGAPVGLESGEWKKALNDAAVTARASCAAERAWISTWNAPVAAPTTGKEEDWHYYLRETQYRTKWSADPPSAGTTVLRMPSAADFQASVKWLEEALTETAIVDHDLRAIGSPDLARLAIEIERIGPSIGRGQLKGVDLVIVADDVHASRIRAALARSGASLEFIDPKRSFPQIAQRMRDQAEVATCQAPDPAPS